MAFNNVNVKILSIDQNNISMTIDGLFYRVETNRMKRLIDSNDQSNLEAVLRNMAIRLSLSGISSTDFAGIKTTLESVTFKF